MSDDDRSARTRANLGPLAEPFDGTPSEALQAGYCPSCGGTGRVERAVVDELGDVVWRVATCLTCRGSATFPPSFTCPRCGRTSYNPNDVFDGYCGACHDWTAE